jgi:hypothetical protein
MTDGELYDNLAHTQRQHLRGKKFTACAADFSKPLASQAPATQAKEE